MTALSEITVSKRTFPYNGGVLDSLLQSRPDLFGEALKNRHDWRIQIIYTQINRSAGNEPKLTHHYFNVDPRRYFYPASTVKMPAAVLALQRVNELKIPRLTKETTMLTGAAAAGQTSVEADSTAASGRPSIAHYIKKIFLVSDNDAYNRLYEFLGQEYLNRQLWARGYDSVQLLHRLQLPLSDEQNRLTNPVRFVDEKGRELYAQPLVKSTYLVGQRQTLLGKGYLSGGKLVEQPFDFSRKNRITLPELHTILQSILLPETLPAKQRFNLTADDYRFLYSCMSLKPSESKHPRYDSSYSDAYVKFLLFGGSGPIANKHLRVFNKVGDAYGFLQDVAYIVDFEKGVEFMLSASIYCNSDGIFNDDKYDYENVGFPFLKNLGKLVYDFEVGRAKKGRPDLSKYMINYTEE